MGSVFSLICAAMRSHKAEVRTVIDAAEEVLVDAVHDVAECADDMVVEL